MDRCMTCGHLIAPDGQALQYAGPLCTCTEEPRVRRRASTNVYPDGINWGLAQHRPLTNEELFKIALANQHVGPHCPPEPPKPTRWERFKAWLQS